MPLTDWIEFVKYGGSIAAPMLLIALLWMDKQRKEAKDEAKEAREETKLVNTKLSDLSERTIVLLTELKGMVTKRS